MNSDWFDAVAARALSTRETLRATYDLASSVLRNGVAGDFVECGVFAGANAAAMARAPMDHGPANGRRLHLFDSFRGIPEAGPEDVEFLEAGHRAGLSACSLEQVQANMAAWCIDPDLLVYYRGSFENTVLVAADPIIGIGAIAVLRLDGDLYESTKVCMEHLYPKVSAGGWVIVDDFHLSGCRKAVNEFVSPGPIYFLK